MSGGHFDYNQSRIDDIVDVLQEAIDNNGKTDITDWTNHDLSEKAIARMQTTLSTLKLASIMTQRVDWLLSGDDGEESFHKRWNEELIETGILHE